MTCATKRRWTSITEATLANDLRDAINARPNPRWPQGWYLWRITTISRELDAIRGTKGSNR